ncbi:MAG: aminopeptidase P family protein [Pseudomonadota bacterium]
MFQNYNDINESAFTDSRVSALRQILSEKNLDGFCVPRSDEHMNEYVPAYAERLLWVTGFSGSAGQAIILQEKAALFVDGRYTLQAPTQVDTALFEILETPQNKMSDWIVGNCKENNRIGFDPKLHTASTIKTLENTLKSNDIECVPVEENLIDLLWQDQPAPPNEAIRLHPLKYAGVKATDKIKTVQETLQRGNLNAVILTQPESIAWLLNIRGEDVPHTPITLCYAIVYATGQPKLYIGPNKLTTATKKVLDKDIILCEKKKLKQDLLDLGSQKANIALDEKTASFWFCETLQNAGARVVHKPDPCQRLKAIKNSAEIKGAYTAHERDGVAVCRFLAWLDANSTTDALDEIEAAKQLEIFRRETGALKEISFDTISGAGPNGAIVHYRVTQKTNRKLKPNSLYLVDSGAQYQEGTTDITRTIAIGKPTKEMKTRFTFVLKGHIQLTLARFPQGTTGAHLDVLARQALWANGLDYAHGTGHGVGSFLSVHESPPGISKRSHDELKPGMIISNEPGYYKAEKYGIRIENLILVSEPEDIKGGEIQMMGFKTLTLTPIDHRLIDTSLLTPPELKWLNSYHALVRQKIGQQLSNKDKAWLRDATRPMLNENLSLTK